MLRLMTEKKNSRRLSEGEVQHLAWKTAMILTAGFMKFSLATSSKNISDTDLILIFYFLLFFLS